MKDINPRQLTFFSRAFTGRLARYLENGDFRKFTEEEKVPLPFSLQHRLSDLIKNQATVLADIEHAAICEGADTPPVEIQKRSRTGAKSARRKIENPTC